MQHPVLSQAEVQGRSLLKKSFQQSFEAGKKRQEALRKQVHLNMISFLLPIGSASSLRDTIMFWVRVIRQVSEVVNGTVSVFGNQLLLNRCAAMLIHGSITRGGIFESCDAAMC